MRFLTLIGDLIILNLLFILTSLPIITIGASLTALYSMTMRLIRNEEGTSTAKGYIQAFRDNFKKGTATGLLVLLIGAVLAVNAILILKDGENYSGFMKYVLVLAAVMYALLFSWIFALTARFENNIRNTLKNSLFLALSHPVISLCAMICTFFPLILLYWKTYWFLYSLAIWSTVGLAALCYLNSLSFVRIFRKLEGYSHEITE